MKARNYLCIAFASFCIAPSADADEAGAKSLVSPGNLNNTPGWERQGSTSNSQYLNYFLVGGAENYNGDTLDFSWRQYKLSRSGTESTGRYFFWGELLLLWNRESGTYDLLNVQSLEEGVWKSCWGQAAESVHACDESTELVYIFDSESAAMEFDNPAATDDGLAEGPEPTQPEPEPEPSQPVDIASVLCSASPEELKAALLQATNESRSQARRCGNESFAAADELAWNPALAAAARKHSRDMASNNFFSHTGSDGLQVWDRANAEGYQYRYIGENIAAGQQTVGVVQSGWIDSPGHCSNIMAPQIVEMGAACVVSPGSDYTRYWTVVVGQPR